MAILAEVPIGTSGIGLMGLNEPYVWPSLRYRKINYVKITKFEKVKILNF